LNETVRKAIQAAHDEFLTAEARLYDHTSSTYRWLMATLFTANGGGLVALFGKGEEQMIPLCAFVWFALGLIFSILIGALSCFVSYRVSSKMAKARAKMNEGLIGDDADEHFVDEVLRMLKEMKPTWKIWFPSYAAGASLVFLILGMIAVAPSLGFFRQSL
jgi:hypothetical protein